MQGLFLLAACTTKGKAVTTYICPKCGHTVSVEGRVESVECTACGRKMRKVED